MCEVLFETPPENFRKQQNARRRERLAAKERAPELASMRPTDSRVFSLLPLCVVRPVSGRSARVRRSSPRCVLQAIRTTAIAGNRLPQRRSNMDLSDIKVPFSQRPRKSTFAEISLAAQECPGVRQPESCQPQSTNLPRVSDLWASSSAI